jgi:hypothetical protein
MNDAEEEAMDSEQLLNRRQDFAKVLDDFIEQTHVVGRKMEPIYCDGDAVKQLDEMRRTLVVKEKKILIDECENVKIEDTRVVMAEKDNMWDCESVLCK